MSNDQYELGHLETLIDVKEYIHENLNQPLNRDILATVAGFSVPHLHRIFKAAMGVSMSEYTRELRLERAGYKLRMGAIDIAEVALAAGYQTHATFGKAFKRQYGLSPSDFRQLSCNEATQLLMKGKV